MSSGSTLGRLRDSDSEGKLRAERVAFDTDTIMRQLRGEMTKDQVFDLRNLPADTR